MVSKIAKKAPVKHIKDRRSKLLKRTSPVKSGGSGFSSILAASIKTCHRRLVKIFSKFARIGTGGTPIKKSPKKQGNKIIPGCDEIEYYPRRSLHFRGRLLPESNKRTIFLDLDETLVHSKPGPAPIHEYDFMVRPEIEGVKVEFYVTKRPFVDELLATLKQKFELVIFTAGVEEYASLVLEKLDRTAAISHRLYRDSCRVVEGKYVKDLECSGRDLSRAVIVDDNPNSYSLQPENGIPIAPFNGDLGDSELLRLIDFFNERADCYVDMRDAVKLLKNAAAVAGL